MPGNHDRPKKGQSVEDWLAQRLALEDDDASEEALSDRDEATEPPAPSAPPPAPREPPPAPPPPRTPPRTITAEVRPPAPKSATPAAPPPRRLEVPIPRRPAPAVEPEHDTQPYPREDTGPISHRFELPEPAEQPVWDADTDPTPTTSPEDEAAIDSMIAAVLEDARERRRSKAQERSPSASGAWGGGDNHGFDDEASEPELSDPAGRFAGYGRHNQPEALELDPEIEDLEPARHGNFDEVFPVQQQQRRAPPRRATEEETNALLQHTDTGFQPTDSRTLERPAPPSTVQEREPGTQWMVNPTPAPLSWRASDEKTEIRAYVPGGMEDDLDDAPTVIVPPPPLPPRVPHSQWPAPTDRGRTPPPAPLPPLESDSYVSMLAWTTSGVVIIFFGIVVFALIVFLMSSCSPAPATAVRADPPELADPARARFVAIGDTGKGNATQRRVAGGVSRICAERGCDWVLLLGDNLYPRGLESASDPRLDERIVEMYADTDAPIYVVLGNHDYGTGRDTERAAWQVAWASHHEGVHLPAPIWWFEAGPVLLAGLDTNAALHFGADPQARWLRGLLDASDAPYKMVAGHHPYRSDGPHGNAGSYEGWSVLPIASGRSLRGLFDDTLCGRADLYLAGHDHSRQLLSHCGVHLVVSGAGASATSIVDRGNQPRFAEAEPGAAWFDVGADGATVAFVDEEGRVDGEFTLPP